MKLKCKGRVIIMLAMTRAVFEKIDFDELLEWLNEYSDVITDEDMLKEFAIDRLHDDNFGLALHIINAIYENPYDTEWYRYDYNMGTLETPCPITSKEDVEDLVDFVGEEEG